MNESPTLFDEERLTAYALNEVDAAERGQIDAFLKNDPAAQKLVNEIRATADSLTDELKRERFADLAKAAPEAVPALKAVSAPKAQPSRYHRPAPKSGGWFWTLASCAAALVIGYFGWLQFGPALKHSESMKVAASTPAPVIGNEGPGTLYAKPSTPVPEKPDRVVTVSPQSKYNIAEDESKSKDTSRVNSGAVAVKDFEPMKKEMDPSSKKPVDAPQDVMKKAEIGDHFETINTDKPDTRSAHGTPDAKVFGNNEGSKMDGVKGTATFSANDSASGVVTVVPIVPPSTVPAGPEKAPSPVEPPRELKAPVTAYGGKVSSETPPVNGPAPTKVAPPMPLSTPVQKDSKDKKDKEDGYKFANGTAERDTTIKMWAKSEWKYGDASTHEFYKVEPAPNVIQPGGETYPVRPENGFESVRSAPLSTFSADVDTASYSNVRRFLGQNQLPPPDAVRTEELINYFRYKYEMAKGEDPFSASIEGAACPWNTSHRLVRVAIKAHDLVENRRPQSNLVFLIDVSGSMDAPNRLPLVKDGMKSLVRKLGETDRVAIVTYAGDSGVALASTNCSDKDRILGVIDGLRASGGTNGGAGIQTAYATAKANFVKEGVNRVILATDGDFNVGVTSTDELVKLIEVESKSGVFLTALGYGMGNYKDATLQRLADKGHGNYAYIDSQEESRKVLLEQMNSTLVSVAKDVKFQIEFNPGRVAEYRLIGYEKRAMPAQDFNDDTKDAGVIGAGHTVTAFYEIVPVNGAGQPGVDGLKYQPKTPEPAPKDAANPEMLTLKIRYKTPEANASKRVEFAFVDKGESFERASGEFKFASAVALFGQVLKHSPFVGNAMMRNVVELADDARGVDEGGYRREFIQLVRKAGELRGERY